MIRIQSAQHELEVEVLIELSIHCTFKADIHSSWASSLHSCNVVKFLIAFNFDPTSGSKCTPHRWVPNRDTEVFLSFLRHKCLIERSRLVSLWTGVITVVAFLRLFVAVVISIKPLVDPTIVINHVLLIIILASIPVLGLEILPHNAATIHGEMCRLSRHLLSVCSLLELHLLPMADSLLLKRLGMFLRES